MPLFLVFLAFPFVELVIFVFVSTHIGFWTTIGLCLLTALLGSALLRFQGFQTLFALRKAANKGKMPLNEIFDGFCLVAAGVLLITPGFLSDVLGFLLLIPVFRNVLRRTIVSHTTWTSEMTYNETSVRRPFDPNALEGEFTRVETENVLPPDGDKPH
jgi:UPF0716 protein FxsA